MLRRVLMAALLMVAAACSPGKGTNTECENECAIEGQTRCAFDTIQRCSLEQGCLVWKDLVLCTLEDKVCDDSRGYAACVEPQDASDNNDGSGTGDGTEPEDPCAGSCVPGERRCAGTRIEECIQPEGEQCPVWDDSQGIDCANNGWECLGGKCVIPGTDPKVEPPLGDTSGGSGGPMCDRVEPGSPSHCVFRHFKFNGYECNVVLPLNLPDPVPLMIVYAGEEGPDAMSDKLAKDIATRYEDTRSFMYIVINGQLYSGTSTNANIGAQAGAALLDWARQNYNIDNDRTYLLSNGRGTLAGLKLGFHLRQSYFAAYWANDVTASDTPAHSSHELGFAPWGNAGPGGNFMDAENIVKGMQMQGYRLPTTAPYAGVGSSEPGSPEQFDAAIEFFIGKSRQ